MKKAFAVLTVLLLSISANLHAADGIPIVFSLKDGLDPQNVYITFFNCVDNATSVTGTYNNGVSTGQTISPNVSIKLSDTISTTPVADNIPTGVPAIFLTTFKSGRIYISYNGGITSPLCSQPSTEPDSSDANLATRYQPVEMDVRLGNSTTSVETAVINTNLTYIDYAAIALSLSVINATSGDIIPESKITNNPLLTNVTSEILTDALASKATTAYSTVYPSAADKLPSTLFARVLSPTSLAWYSKYSDWTHYLQTTLYNSTTTNNLPVRIKGLFGGVGGQPANKLGAGIVLPNATYQAQSYDYLVTFDQYGNATMTAQSGSGNGTCLGIDAVNRGEGVGPKDINILFSDLNAATGIYGNNVPYKVAGTANRTTGVVNDFYGWVVGDLLAGLSWGLPGSTVNFTSDNGTVSHIGNMTSVQWYGGRTESGYTYSVPLSPVGRGYTYARAQPGNPTNYHTYAAALKGMTGAYGFGLQDRSGQTLINFNRVDHPTAYLEIGIDTKGQSAVQAAKEQKSGVTVTMNEYKPKTMTQLEIQSQYGYNEFTAHTSVCSFNATVSPAGEVGVFVLNTDAIPDGLGNGYKLMKFLSSGTTAEYGPYAANDQSRFTDGAWWITDINGNYMTASTMLTKGEHYNINFVIKDNGPFDEDPDPGEITDPVALGSVGTDATGCVLNPRGTFKADFLLLLAAAGAGIIMRRKIK
ncbi:hypothetical protein [Maridesulfovibrio sp. FT414]|uniref:hypothetical protein n=1 Tax=Maridesulfovibrio sp. FT414 TaxID=2979469 RepID=UPI003D807B3E